jgi:hypothetical protein
MEPMKNDDLTSPSGDKPAKKTYQKPEFKEHDPLQSVSATYYYYYYN